MLERVELSPIPSSRRQEAHNAITISGHEPPLCTAAHICFTTQGTLRSVECLKTRFETKAAIGTIAVAIARGKRSIRSSSLAGKGTPSA